MTQHTDVKALAKAFEAAFAEPGTEGALRADGARYNLPPGTPLAVVRHEEGAAGGARRIVVRARWGLEVAWQAGRLHANARAEGIEERPAFKAAVAARRCLIPADGFYEWDRRYQPRKPYYFQAREGALALAGIWEWGSLADGVPIMTVAVVTREAAGPVATVHDRMPLFIPPALYEAWLRPEGALSMASFLREGLRVEVTQTAVSLAVNDARRDGPELVRAVAGPTGARLQGDLFGG